MAPDHHLGAVPHLAASEGAVWLPAWVPVASTPHLPRIVTTFAMSPTDSAKQEAAVGERNAINVGLQELLKVCLGC